MPARRISIASVKMKALKPSLITRKPLKAPTASPTSRTIAIPRSGSQLVPRPWPSFETISQAPTIGARPYVDCRDRSNLPVSRIRLSATTTAPNAADSCATLIKLSAVRKAGFTKAPTTSRRMITGNRASSLIQLATMCRPWRRRVPAIVCSDRSTGRSTVDLLILNSLFSFRFPSRGGRLEALDRGDQLMPVPGRLTVLLDQSTLDHDEQSRADAQVLQVVRDQQHCRAAIAGRADHVEERLLGGHVNADRRRNRDQDRWLPGERSSDNDLLLVSPTQLPDLLVEAARDDTQLFHQPSRDSVAARARNHPPGR